MLESAGPHNKIKLKCMPDKTNKKCHKRTEARAKCLDIKLYKHNIPSKMPVLNSKMGVVQLGIL
jgi:hypothetical protein